MIADSGYSTLWTGTHTDTHAHRHAHSSSRNSQRPTMLPLIRLDISPDKYLSSCRLSVSKSAINAALMCAQFFRLARAALARRSLICASIVWATTRYERLGRHTAKSNTPAMPINIALRLPRWGQPTTGNDNDGIKTTSGGGAGSRVQCKIFTRLAHRWQLQAWQTCQNVELQTEIPSNKF